MMAGLLLSPNRWSGLEQSSNVVRTAVASAQMSPSSTTSSHVVRHVAPGGPVCPSRTSVSCLVQSCSMRSTYAASVYGWILCSARVRAWASSWYRVQCRGAGLGGGVAAGPGSRLLLLGFPVSVPGGGHQGVLVILSPRRPFQVGFPRGRSGRSASRGACVGGPCLVMQDDGVAPCPTV